MPNGGDFSFIDRVFQNLSRVSGLDVARDVQDPAAVQALTPPDERIEPGPKTLEQLRKAFSIDQIIAETQGSFSEVLDRPNVIQSLAQGIGEGIFTPLEIFTGPPDEEIDPAHPIAKTIGQLGGILVSFVPLFAGTRIALAGIGLTKALKAYPVLNRVIEGALAFGIFEAGAGAPSGIPERFAKGAVIGGAFEFAIVKMFPGKALASRKGKSRKGQPIAPEDVNVERNIHPGGTSDPAEMSSRIINLADPGVETDQVLMQIAQIYKPGGTALVRNVTEPGPLISRILQKFPNIETRVRSGAEKGIFEILVRDTGESQPRLIQSLLGIGFVKVTGIPAAPGFGPKLSRVADVVKKLVSRGGPESVFEAPILTLEESVRLIELDAFGELGIPVVKNLTGQGIRHVAQIEGSVRGLATFKPNRIFISTEQTFIQRFESLIHEFMHHVTRNFVRGRFVAADERELAELILGRELTTVEIESIKRGGAIPLTLEEVFNIRPGRIERTDPFKGSTRGRMVTFDEKAAKLVQEFDRVTIEILQRATTMTQDAALIEFAGRLDYYREAEEMISAMAELLFLDAGAARRLAPRASRLVSSLINKESPKMRMLLSKQEHRNVDDWFRFVLQGDRAAEILGRTVIEDVPKFAEQLATDGGFKGMRVVVAGQTREWVRRIGDDVIVRDAATGALQSVPFRLIFRPIGATQLKQSALINQTIRKVFNKFRETPTTWVGMTLFDVENDGVRRAVLELANFETIRGGGEGLSRWATEHNLPRFVETEEILAKVRDIGKDGIILEDGGTYIAYVAKPEALRVTEDVLYEGLLDAPSGFVGDNVLLLKFNSVAESILRQAGATERELPFFLETARLEFGDDLFQLMNPELKSIINTLFDETATLRIIEDVETFVGRANLKAEQIGPNRWRLREPDTGVEVFRGTEEQIRNFTARASLDDGAVDLIEGQISSGMFKRGFGGGGPPPKFQTTEMATPPPEEVGGWLRRVLDQVNLFAPFAVAMENFTKSAENVGLGALFTKIYNPGQEAVARRIPLEMGATIRPELGKTWNDQIRLIQDLAQKVKPNRREFTKGLSEATSREEVEQAGGLLDRVMSNEEITVAKFMEKLGMDLEIPRLLAITEMVQNLIKNKKSFLTRADRLAADSPELAPVIQELRTIARNTPDKPSDIIRLLDLSGEEKAAINILEPLLERSPNDFSIFAVSRWLDAPVAGPGKTGRQAFIAANDMTVEEIAVSVALDDLLASAFSNSNIDAIRQVKGFWPHWRKWAEQGFVLNRGLGKRLAPENSIAWADKAYRAGELGVYVTDPVVYAYKQVMNLMMKRHLEPRLPDMVKEIATIRAAGESRLADLMDEYMMEIRGRPHGTFERLNKALTRFAESMGVKNPQQHVESYTNSIVSTAYSATIPFRPNLIARNYFQMWQMTPPRIGLKWFLIGFKESTTQEGFQRAVTAGAVPIDVLPLFASDAITNLRAFQTLQLRLKRLFERGFNWYRKADDFGRAVAYNGLRARVKNFLGPFMREEITWEQFLTKSKVRTFHPVDQKIFGELFSVGRVDDAIDHLGTTLSRETHFRYAHAAHPAGWGSIYGRVFGQFGTWPVQYKDFLLEGAARGTAADKIEFFGTHIGMNLGLAGAGAFAGVNLWSFVSFNALQYTGGPFADIALDLVRAYGGTPAEQQLARRSLIFNFPSFSDPRSVFIPGSYFVADVSRALSDPQANIPKFVFQAGGFKFFEPDEKTGFEWFINP